MREESVIIKQKIDSFEEWLQFSVGAMYDLDTILTNLMTDEIAEEVRLYAIAVAKEALKNASENAVIEPMGMMTRVDKQSILSENNIPELK